MRRLARYPGALALLGCLTLGVGLAGAAEKSAADLSDSGYAGGSLIEALRDLESRGLKLVFTSSVVRPDMRVEVEPTATEPRSILDELLAPHGLEAREGPGGTLAVVVTQAAQRQAGIRGVVRSRDSSSPVGGAGVRVVETGLEVLTDADGGFYLPATGVGTFTLEVRLAGYLVQRLDGVQVKAGDTAAVTIMLDPAPIIGEELTVTPSRISLLREEPAAPVGLSRDEILALPHLGDDFFRALSLLPGAAANDVSARFHIRGGRRDETQILLDGQELYDAYHLKDFDGALSFVSSATLDSADLTTGGFSAEYGDRMSGVLDMTTVKPSGPIRVRLGAGVLSAHAGAAGSFQGDRGGWMAEVRRGSIDLVARLIGDEDPRYWDAFGKLDYRLGPRNSLRANLLYSGDNLDFEEVIDNERKRLETEYNSAYVWLTHQAIVSDKLFFETAASLSNIDRDRRGREVEEDGRFTILDQRDSRIVGLRQRWSYQVTPQQSLEWGWQLREFDTDYDYFGTRSLENPLAQIRHDFGVESTVFRGRFREPHNAVFVADRFRLLDPLTFELGLRNDWHELTDESHLSPRMNLAYTLGESSVLRLAWGRFNQSQRPYELQIEDGETEFHPVERSEHRVVGLEKLFRSKGASPGLALRVEVYHREVKNPRVRYENLYEPINTFPEVEPDRVRVAPQRSVAEGVEVFLRRAHGPRVGWWVNYTYASTEDVIAGDRIPRIFDQTHALNLDVDYRISERWRVNLAWRYHTGWPTTPLSLQEVVNDEGEVTFVPLLGPVNSERLPTYHRLDLRASRRWRLRSASVDFFVDVQNVYDRENIGGFDFEIDEDEGTLVGTEEAWTGILPSAGISVEF